MAISFNKLRVNDVVDLHMKGSRSYGNAGYMLSNQKVTAVNHDERTIELSDGFDTFEIYFFNNRWRYGSSAEVAKLTKIH